MTFETLAEAFPETRYEGEGSLAMLVSAFGTLSPSDPLHSVAGWRDVEADMLLAGPHGDLGTHLTFMAPPMWAHFLPAWVAIAHERGAASGNVLVSVATTLVPELLSATFAGQAYGDRASLLDARQASALRSFGFAIAGEPDIISSSGMDVGLAIAEAMERMPLYAASFGRGRAQRASGGVPPVSLRHPS